MAIQNFHEIAFPLLLGEKAFSRPHPVFEGRAMGTRLSSVLTDGFFPHLADVHALVFWLIQFKQPI